MATPAAEPAPSEARGDSRPPTPDPGPPTIVLDRTGGDIYHRSYMGLKSRIPEEVEQGLYHLVRLSDIHQEVLLFDEYSGLAEALLQQILTIGELVHGISWEPNYDYAYFNDEYKANARFDDLCAEGTFDLLDRLRRLEVIFPQADVLDDETNIKLRLVNEAALVLRNMCQVDLNAHFLKELPLARDTATIVLKLPPMPVFNEMKNHMLEVVSEACLWWPLWDNDHLFCTLMLYLDSKDRFHLLTALKALVMFSYELEGIKKFGLAKSVFTTLIDYLYLEQDPELMSAVLDFIYQYVCEPDNVAFILENFDLPTTLIPRLVALLLYDAERQHEIRVYADEQKRPTPTRITIPPERCVNSLLGFQEPERTARWAQCVFQEDSEGEIAQRAVWVAYQQTFADFLKPEHSPLLPAPDFINTVTHAFSIARARVINEGEQGQKFVIQGIRPRDVCRDMNGFPYYYCKWRVPKNPKPAASDELPALPPNADAGKAQGASVADGQGTASSSQSSAPTPPTNYRLSTAEDEKNEQPAPGRAWEKATVAGAPVYPQGPPKPRNPENDKRLADETPARIPQYLELGDLSIIGHSMNHPDLEYCNRVWVDPEKYRKHVLCVHMGIRNSTDGNWYPFDRFKKVPNPVCHFDKCEEFEKPTKNLNLVAAHVSGHLPPLINMEDTPLEWGRPFFYPKRFIRWDYFATPQDENKEPYGIAYKALLIMRNILQNTPRTKPKGRFEGTESWGVALYYSRRARLLEVADLNPTLRKEIFDFVNDIDNSRWGFIFEL
ncbi:hypothetical protein CPC735_051380 [Coccidioides posadasii C735 delta SOWgp]|uniref:RFX-type winged-helix domain-containing protein n=1 Tax=Coccidioides posadasii (strain C735) TaxID=222929 RepID=C5PGW5_COCP7|nr:hypothetical protein CPC735_051380 [Coccidioides posadasii C735 delta SOWgp]EER23768.1 hypothetical protein CPC735_051380 [Coccidioides posadasii C735 delta SOWgp]|eukprot:XP_003065913.1 hypothetical protein CPC735_051380 [Coccidioides posadasii C735 delta SOWgp]